MPDFGFSIFNTRTINLDNCDPKRMKDLEQRVVSFRRCIQCGGCSATCSAGMFTPFNIRKIHSLFRRFQYKDLAEELQKCMLCGKCTLVCPRGVNLRPLILNMRKLLAENTKSDSNA